MTSNKYQFYSQLLSYVEAKYFLHLQRNGRPDTLYVGPYQSDIISMSGNVLRCGFNIIYLMVTLLKCYAEYFTKLLGQTEDATPKVKNMRILCRCDDIFEIYIKVH